MKLKLSQLKKIIKEEIENLNYTIDKIKTIPPTLSYDSSDYATKYSEDWKVKLHVVDLYPWDASEELEILFKNKKNQVQLTKGIDCNGSLELLKDIWTGCKATGDDSVEATFTFPVAKRFIGSDFKDEVNTSQRSEGGFGESDSKEVKELAKECFKEIYKILNSKKEQPSSQELAMRNDRLGDEMLDAVPTRESVKIKLSQLKKIIKEEVTRVLKEVSDANVKITLNSVDFYTKYCDKATSTYESDAEIKGKYGDKEFEIGLKFLSPGSYSKEIKEMIANQIQSHLQDSEWELDDEDKKYANVEIKPDQIDDNNPATKKAIKEIEDGLDRDQQDWDDQPDDGQY